LIKTVTGKDVEILPYPKMPDFDKKIKDAVKRYFEKV